MSLMLLEQAAAFGAAAVGPEPALRAMLSPLHAQLGLRDGGADLPSGADQFFVAGAFLVTPDAGWHMLTANIGFPPEQTRLMIPIDGGHPGRVRKSEIPLHLPDTQAVAGAFKQYLKTARMGSAIYVPMMWQGHFLGQIVLAGFAPNSLRTVDFSTMCAAGPMAAALWMANNGQQWLQSMYPPADAHRVSLEGA